MTHILRISMLTLAEVILGSFPKWLERFDIVEYRCLEKQAIRVGN